MKRELGCVEKIAWLRNKSAPNNFLISLELEGEIDNSSIRAVLDILQKKYPPLRVKVKETSVGNPYFTDYHVGLIPLYFDYIDENTNISNFILDELAYNIPINIGPLARISCLVSKGKKIFHLIILINHIICDGVAIGFFAKDFLDILDKINSNKILLNSIYDVRPPVESYFYDQINDKQFKKQILNANYFDKFMNKNHLSTISVPTEKLHTRFITHKISEHESKLLLINTKKYDVTLTNIICAAYIQAFYDHHIDEEINFKNNTNKDITIMYNIPINLRPYCKTYDGSLTSKDMGCFTSSLDILHTLKKEKNIWCLAKKLNTIFNVKIQNHYHLQKMYMRMMVAKETIQRKAAEQSIFIDYIKKTRGTQENIPQLFLSNIGRINFSAHYSNFSLKNINFMVSVHDILRTNNSYALLVYTNEANGSISLTMPFSSPVINQDSIESMLSKIINNLKIGIS